MDGGFRGVMWDSLDRISERSAFHFGTRFCVDGKSWGVRGGDSGRARPEFGIRYAVRSEFQIRHAVCGELETGPKRRNFVGFCYGFHAQESVTGNSPDFKIVNANIISCIYIVTRGVFCWQKRNGFVIRIGRHCYGTRGKTIGSTSRIERTSI